MQLLDKSSHKPLRRQKSERLSELISMIGEEKTLILIEYNAGCTLYVPQTPTGNMYIVELLGLDTVKTLSENYGGEHFFIPMAKEWRIEQYYKQGLSARAIALKVGLGVNSIHNTLKRMKDYA